ncbi:hypothetical protein [Psychrobacillus sp. FJAT-21963]|nr:hypothetical protein [Psychrobacillus sp. FJAT-21963]
MILMHVELDAKVKRWLQSKGEHVSVKTIQVNACCAPPRRKTSK